MDYTEFFRAVWLEVQFQRTQRFEAAGYNRREWARNMAWVKRCRF